MADRSAGIPSRRTFLTGSAMAAGAMLSHGITAPPVARAQVQPPRDDGTVRDRFWLWTHPAGSHNYIKMADGSPAYSRMTPVEGAVYMGLHNIYFVHYDGKPTLDHYDLYATSFKPMKRVVWSMAGVGGESNEELRKRTLEIARANHNVTGFILDDFLHYFHTVNTHWVAANRPAFPVTLQMTANKPVMIDRVQLVQSVWPTGDYRTGTIALEATTDGTRWEPIKEAVMPKAAGAALDIALPARAYTALRVRVLSTQDRPDSLAQSCGLRAVRLFHDGKRIAFDDQWQAQATSEFSASHSARNLLLPENADVPVPASMTPEQLADLHSQMDLGDGRKMHLDCVIYTHQMSPRITAHTDHVDRVAMWTWKSAGLANLESNFETISNIVKKPIMLGCYMYDYGFAGDDQPISVEHMQYQCELGLKWLKEGRIEGIIFLASNICDMNFEAVEWTRQWIAKVGDQRL